MEGGQENQTFESCLENTGKSEKAVVKCICKIQFFWKTFLYPT